MTHGRPGWRKRMCSRMRPNTGVSAREPQRERHHGDHQLPEQQCQACDIRPPSAACVDLPAVRPSARSRFPAVQRMKILLHADFGDVAWCTRQSPMICALGPAANTTTTRSASRSWVTNSTALRSAFQDVEQEIAHDLPGLGISSGPNGSSIKRIFGSRISTCARPTRLRCPPDSMCG